MHDDLPLESLPPQELPGGLGGAMALRAAGTEDLDQHGYLLRRGVRDLADAQAPPVR